MALIGADQTFALSAILMVVVAFGMWAEARPWGQKLGGPLILIAVAMALSNLQIIPYSSPVYDSLAGFLVPMAIPLLIMRADFRTIFSESGPMFITFIVATVATLIGALAGALVIDLGTLEAEIAGTVASSYIGGSLNYVATAKAVGLDESAIYVAGLSADAVGAVFFLILLMLMPAVGFIRRALPSKFIGTDRGQAPQDHVVDEPPPVQPFNPPQIVNGLAVSLVVCAAGMLLTSLSGMDSLFILVVTALSLLVANFAKPVIRHVSSEFEVGTLFMYLFFVIIGAGANLGDVVSSAFPILLFIMVMVVVHLVVVVVAGKFMKLDLAEVMIASNACILGPAPAAALAASKGWRPLVTPGIMVGLFGYAIATFIGVSLTTLLQ